MPNYVEIGGKIYQETETPPPSVHIKKVKTKRKPKSKERLKIEFWAVFFLIGFLIIVWAMSIIKTGLELETQTSARTGQRTHMRN